MGEVKVVGCFKVALGTVPARPPITLNSKSASTITASFKDRLKYLSFNCYNIQLAGTYL
jgi:hypothetical protein